MSDMFDGTLDLSGADADAVGFPAIPSGKYEAVVAKETSWKTTTNVDGTKKLPDNTPYLNVAVQVSQDEEPRDGQNVAGAYVWAKLFVPPADHDASAAQRMKNAMANFLGAIGEDWQKKNYKMPDVEDLIGRDVCVVVKKKWNDYTNDYGNEVVGFKPAGSSKEADEPSGMLV